MLVTSIKRKKGEAKPSGRDAAWAPTTMVHCGCLQDVEGRAVADDRQGAGDGLRESPKLHGQASTPGQCGTSENPVRSNRAQHPHKGIKKPGLRKLLKKVFIY